MEHSRQAVPSGAGRRRRARRGSSILEASLLCPWIFFIFAGVFDVGTYLNALISTENAARTAGLYYVSSQRTNADKAKACRYVLEILNNQPNMRHAASCMASPTAVSRMSPVALSMTGIASGPDGQPATTVSVTYQSGVLIPIPLLVPSQLTVTRTVEYKG